MDGQLFTPLIEFSWTLCAFIYAAQGWLFLQDFKGNRIPKLHHVFLVFSFLANTVATAAVFFLLSLVLNESLKESKNFVAEDIKCARNIYTYSIIASVVLTVVALITWLIYKNTKASKQGSQNV